MEGCLMEALVRAAKATIIQKLSDLQIEIDDKLDRPNVSGAVEEMRDLRDEIMSLKDRLENI